MWNGADWVNFQVGWRVVFDVVPANYFAAAVLYSFECFLAACNCCFRCLCAWVGAPCDGGLDFVERPLAAAVNWAAVVGIGKEERCGWMEQGVVSWEHEPTDLGFVLTLCR